MKRAIAYIRVSGLGQADKDGESRQSESIRTFCAANGLQYWEQRFEVISGTVEGLDRPVFSEVLDLVASRDEEFEAAHGVHDTALSTRVFRAAAKREARPCIVVERMDRFARDLMVQELLLRECRERGIEVYAADQPFIDIASDLGDPTRKLFRQILGALAEWEKSALVLKLRKARDRKRAETGRCEGVLPYHLTAEGMAVIKRIEAGRESGVSVPGIARRLNESGLTTRNGKSWTKRLVLHVLQKYRNRGE